MAKKPKRRSKHIPRRTCVGCREVLPKRSMVRIVNGPEGVSVDLSGNIYTINGSAGCAESKVHLAML